MPKEMDMRIRGTRALLLTLSLILAACRADDRTRLASAVMTPFAEWQARTPLTQAAVRRRRAVVAAKTVKCVKHENRVVALKIDVPQMIYTARLDPRVLADIRRQAREMASETPCAEARRRKVLSYVVTFDG